MLINVRVRAATWKTRWGRERIKRVSRKLDLRLVKNACFLCCSVSEQAELLKTGKHGFLFSYLLRFFWTKFKEKNS